MGDGEAKALGQEGKPADGRRRLELPRLFLCLHEGGLAGRPGHRLVRPERDMIDPAVLGIGRQRVTFALQVGCDHLAVVATGEDAFAVGRRRENSAAVRADAPRLAVGLREHDRFLAEHERRCPAEKIRGDDGAVGRDLMRAVDDGVGVV